MRESAEHLKHLEKAESLIQRENERHSLKEVQSLVQKKIRQPVPDRSVIDRVKHYQEQLNQSTIIQDQPLLPANHPACHLAGSSLTSANQSARHQTCELDRP